MIKLINRNNKALKLASVILCAVVVLVMMIPTAHAGSYTLLKYGSRGSEVTELQQALHDEGYLSVNPTGYYGTLTQDAVIRFQNDNGLTVDGIAGNETQTTLYKSGATGTTITYSPTVRYGSSGWAVTDLQTLLEKYGYYNYGSITGYFRQCDTLCSARFPECQRTDSRRYSRPGYVDKALFRKRSVRSGVHKQ